MLARLVLMALASAKERRYSAAFGQSFAACRKVYPSPPGIQVSENPKYHDQLSAGQIAGPRLLQKQQPQDTGI